MTIGIKAFMLYDWVQYPYRVNPDLFGNALKKGPKIACTDPIEVLFENDKTIEPFEIIEQKTEWPLPDQSVKTLIRYLGFKWRDENTSQATSVEWYHQ